jgi:pilus assembly protein Flp/PilA
MVAAGCPFTVAVMNARSCRGNLIARITSTYIRLREVARGPLDHGLSRREEGQGMVEYALILVLIAIVVVVILTTVGKQVKNVFSNISSGLGT